MGLVHAVTTVPCIYLQGLGTGHGSCDSTAIVGVCVCETRFVYLSQGRVTFLVCPQCVSLMAADCVHP